MLEVILIMSIINACKFMPFRGKTFNQLTPLQQQKLNGHYWKYMGTKKGRQTPNMTVEEYLPILQGQALKFLIMAIVTVPIYVLAIMYIYAPYFQG